MGMGFYLSNVFVVEPSKMIFLHKILYPKGECDLNNIMWTIVSSHQILLTWFWGMDVFLKPSTAG